MHEELGQRREPITTSYDLNHRLAAAASSWFHSHVRSSNGAALFKHAWAGRYLKVDGMNVSEVVRADEVAIAGTRGVDVQVSVCRLAAWEKMHQPDIGPL